MIIGIYGYADCGKTLLATAIIKRMLAIRQFTEPVSVISLPSTNARKLSVEEMRRFVLRLVDDEIKHTIVFLDEVDKIFKARDWKDKDQIDAVTNFWQTFKLFDTIIYTAHRGRGTDITLRLATDWLLLPRIKGNDILFEANDLQHDGIKKPRYYRLNSIDRFFKEYDRWELVK